MTDRVSPTKKALPQRNTVKAWQFTDLLLEKYLYVPGAVEPLPKHSHEEYQIGFSLDSIGEYFYRGTYSHIPVGSFSVLHSGEVHKAREVTRFDTPCSFWMLYIKPSLFHRVTEELISYPISLPFFRPIVTGDRTLTTKFLQMCHAIEQEESLLKRESLQLNFIGYLLLQYADIRSSLKPLGQEHQWVKQIREYLEAHITENVSLEFLSRMVNLSPHYLNRVFRQEVGLPPHQYQTQIRIDRAKVLLHHGLSIKQVAQQLGFADPSHFTRHFKQLVQVTPGQYLSQ